MVSDGRVLAEKRLNGLHKRFVKNPDLFKNYCDKISQYVTKNAEPVPDPDVKNRAGYRYTSLHCTVEEAQLWKKFRVVFDCSARSQGESLNDKLFPGPDLTNTVAGVLIPFRRHPVAISRACFYRYLWKSLTATFSGFFDTRTMI